MTPRRVKPIATVLMLAVFSTWGAVSEPARAVEPDQRTCETTTGQTAAPDEVALNGRVTVTLTLTADCSAVHVPVHVALVFDNSVAMGGTRMNYMRMAVGAFVDSLDFSVARVGLVRYQVTADILSPLTADPDQVKSAAQQFFPRPGSNLTMGIRAGRLILEQGRNLAVAPDVEDVMILLVGSANDNGPEEALAEAQAAKDAGITIVAIAGGLDADGETLEQIATSSSLYYTEGTSSRFPSLFQTIASDIGSVRLTAATVANTLPDAWGYVFGSGFPVPRIRGQDLTWQFGVWPPDGVTIVYELEARELGRHLVSAGATAELSLDRGPPQQAAFPVPEVLVVPGPSATPPMATPSPQPTATVRLSRVYLPLLMSAHCLVGGPADIVLVFDTSASMLEPAPAGGRRMDYVLESGVQLLDALRRPQERGAVIAVADSAVVLQGLSVNHGALVSAVGRIYSHVGHASRLDEGLAAATALLDGRGQHSGRDGWIVLVTDGTADRARAETAAAASRGRGYMVVAVGFGTDAPPEWLRRVSFHPDLAIHSDEAAGLPAAFDTLRRRIVCGAVAPR